ncbi:hypothetical protein L198_00556 [Cryptococcus wingfieldii CBS 7118]|uniref:Uncharacterized protein n=1 Tax=Cryptococcus wingfieldii CBS 7118 TaxID=1295528 RepID=A0A1E3K7J1_9TREE|nr:hypothetical protein L198_00556 [Cryptococcus wingfieldii CBS 7118]ODO08823.1 hypothetical protein L198_00556 [Cryptococcus wingfieldii CBS 7118]
MPGFEKYKDRNYKSRQDICECCNQLVSKGTRDYHQSRLKKRDRGAEQERLEGEGSKRARHMNEDQESENEGRGGDLVIDDEPRGEDVEDDIEQRSQQMSSQGLRHGVSGGNLLVAGDERGNRNSAEPPNSQMQHRAPPSLSQAPSTVDSLPDANDSDAEDERAGEVVPGDENQASGDSDQSGDGESDGGDGSSGDESDDSSERSERESSSGMSDEASASEQMRARKMIELGPINRP